ncbi:MAG TPA: hypothetical protein EYN79_01320, partial [Planctomycetes bacterium]|nr:hypothetical protein [Planctomycetota bacterium]
MLQGNGLVLRVLLLLMVAVMAPCIVPGGIFSGAPVLHAQGPPPPPPPPPGGPGGIFNPLGPMPAPPQNPLTEEKALLGKFLFWEEQLSHDNSIS